jgi:hypothetical protein
MELSDYIGKFIAYDDEDGSVWFKVSSIFTNAHGKEFFNTVGLKIYYDKRMQDYDSPRLISTSILEFAEKLVVIDPKTFIMTDEIEEKVFMHFLDGGIVGDINAIYLGIDDLKQFCVTL